MDLVHFFFDGVLRDGKHELLDTIIHEAYIPFQKTPDSNNETTESNLKKFSGATGIEGLKTRFRLFSEQFGDFSFEMLDVVETKKTVVVHYKGTSTHIGTWNEIPPTGAKLSTYGFILFKFKDNKIFSITSMLRMNEIITQLGNVIKDKVKVQKYIEYFGSLMNL